MRSNRPAVLSVVLCALTVLALLSRASRQPQQVAPPQAPQLKKLDALTGRWTTQGSVLDTPYSHAGNITITATCGWSAYNGYLICDHLFSGPNGKSNDLTIYTYDSAANSYRFYSVDSSGVPHSVPLTVENNIWTYNGEMEKDGKKILIRTVNDFSKPGILEWNSKVSADAGAHWTPTSSGTDTKLDAKIP